jgi:SAM-dependent methyltransferase
MVKTGKMADTHPQSWSDSAMSNPFSEQEKVILKREDALREWFTRGKDPITKIIDGLDIGWGGVQRWATARMPTIVGWHLDLACGYATFLAQLGWRFPKADLVGLNIDFTGPHRLARPLLLQAKVNATLIQADARRLPFADDLFPSISCFLGLQDIEIGFGEEGVKETLADAIRVLQPGGVLILMDEFPFSQFTDLLKSLPIQVVDRAEQSLDVHWTREVGERAIALYADGWVVQTHLQDPAKKKRVFVETFHCLKADLEQQLTQKGYYVPFGPIHMVTGRKRTTRDR